MCKSSAGDAQRAGGRGGEGITYDITSLTSATFFTSETQLLARAWPAAKQHCFLSRDRYRDLQIISLLSIINPVWGINCFRRADSRSALRKAVVHTMCPLHGENTRVKSTPCSGHGGAHGSRQHHVCFAWREYTGHVHAMCLSTVGVHGSRLNHVPATEAEHGSRLHHVFFARRQYTGHVHTMYLSTVEVHGSRQHHVLGSGWSTRGTESGFPIRQLLIAP
ncbi:hypothetical protein J6590_013436 [Homalodisca vitripennis]|nr:hypothetical protein J6590_013436 [Homalodisca vitripennis]